MNGWPEALAALSVEAAQDILDEMDPRLLEELAYDWPAWRRPNQTIPPGDWRYCLVLAGRGFGKTRIGSEWVREQATSGRFEYVNLIGATTDDARDIMIEGESGILRICPAHERPRYRPALRRLDWPGGARSLIFTADEPDRLRGKQHQCFWADELASWRKDTDAWNQAKFGLRLPPDPRALVTTTPKPKEALRKLLRDPATVTLQGTTYDNRSNLDPQFFQEIIKEYEGTALGRQELSGELLTEAEGAQWRRAWLDRSRVGTVPETMEIAAVGIDPPGGTTECGIVAAAQNGDDYYILADASARLPPSEWGAAAWQLALDTKADHVVGERNFGGDMVQANMVAAGARPEFEGKELPPYANVNASRGKAVRSAPWAARTQQGRVHIVGQLDELEDELCTWEPGQGMPSPNRLDAMVWALEALALRQSEWYYGSVSA